ncbi:pepF/M3 family oligoendopeptidase [Paenibacillus endophyticus]|uniref:PepF/M3 family oligoendopeptidase n=1 Tax=Paenibacillus endophyticus TaxID=1294268 RepID=A0A7W5GDC1_9BACL|nr:M3 family oligoendopeptidase [Paenibacillus endophyticus]MBB3154872.1 pepF/M3 family oligoendopeptidase [Paenibacillus endophyticus]
MDKGYPKSWNLDVLYEGGSSSAAFQEELRGIDEDIVKLDAMLLDGTASAIPLIAEMTDLLQSVIIRLRESESFVSCLLAQDIKDSAANARGDRVKTLGAKLLGVLTRFDNVLRGLDDEAWLALLQNEKLAEVAFNLAERRELAKQKMAPELEALAGDLAVDGYHGWGDYYNVIVSRAKFKDTDKEGKTTILSAGQMHNRLSDGDREVRKAAFAEWEREWSEQADLCAETLNRISGFRLKLYDKRGWGSVLKEPLQMNRMSETTLGAMWEAIQESKQVLVAYLARKAKLLGVEKLDWHDVEAPIGSATKTIPYDEAAAFIVEQFRSFSPELADFSQMAFRDGWIEAEDRPGKRPGGFCTSFPKSSQTRIFMTYSGSASNISTLAHELGHAYHQHVMNDLPALSQEYAMNVAETASTFAELIVSDRAFKAATEKEEKLGLLEDKIQRSVAFFMNIHARFLFETRFYEKRRQGLVSVEELNALMEEAQREAYCDMLGEAHPHFWASKLHFYLTDVPFYNFPYTFGYLFSAGIYAKALKEGPDFKEQYVALLRDTGRMTVEQLAEAHLGVNVEEKDFWRDAVALTAVDVEQFIAMTDE